MARKGENIFKRKDGRWEARYIKERKEGKAIYGFVFCKSYSEAKKKKQQHYHYSWQNLSYQLPSPP